MLVPLKLFNMFTIQVEASLTNTDTAWKKKTSNKVQVLRGHSIYKGFLALLRSFGFVCFFFLRGEWKIKKSLLKKENSAKSLINYILIHEIPIRKPSWRKHKTPVKSPITYVFSQLSRIPSSKGIRIEKLKNLERLFLGNNLHENKTHLTIRTAYLHMTWNEDMKWNMDNNEWCVPCYTRRNKFMQFRFRLICIIIENWPNT